MECYGTELIKSSQSCLTAQHNKCSFILLAHSVQMKENYENVTILLTAFKYVQYIWEVIGDFEIVAFLLGFQGGFTKFPCYLCLRDIRKTSLHYKKKNWPHRSSYDIGAHNVNQTPLVEPKKVLLPPFYIKLSLIK